MAKNVRIIPANPMLTPTGKPKSSKVRVAAYCRVSTDEKDQINSFHVQREYYENKINETPEWTNAGIYADEGISGTSMERRPDFMKMLRACRQHKIDLILCKSLSRFARNTVECLDTVRELKGLGISVLFEKENIDTLTQQSEFIITLYSGFAQAESESLSANVRMGKRMGFAQGKVIFRTDMMIGYVKDAAGNPIIEPKGAATVLRIYGSYLAGMSLSQIRDALIKDNVPTATGIKGWSSEAVRNILTNERYMGDALLQKWYKRDCFSKACTRNKGEIPQYYVENNHEGIVSRELFNRVQSEMARRANLKKATSLPGERVKGQYSARYSLTERLICGECGTQYRRCTWVRNGKKRVVWRCISRLEHGKKYCHASPTIDECILHSAIVQAINTILTNREEILQTVMDAIRTAFDNGKDSVDMAGLRQRQTDLKLLLDNLIEQVMNSGEETEELDCQLKSTMDQLEQLEIAIQQRDLEQRAAESENARLQDIMRMIQDSLCALTEYDDTLVRRIVERVTVDGKEQITVSFGYGVDVPIRIP